ncbi:MAG: hypothetical protein WA906_13430 [Pacificimonas sp.]
MRLAVGLAVGAAALAASACAEQLPTYRYKLTVEVDTPEGVVSGSAVREVTSSCSTANGYAGGGASMDVRGEAVAVDLPNGKALFALLSAPTYNGEAEHVAFNVFLREITKGRGFSDSCGHLNYTVKALATGDYRAEVPADMYPTFVWFEEEPDPTSVQQIEPTELSNKFKGYGLTNVTIETSNQPITNILADRLPWLERYYGKYLSGQSVSGGGFGWAYELHSGSFKQGMDE